MLPFFTNIGAYIKSSINAVNASLSASGTINGTSTQIVGPAYQYKSAQFGLYLGAATGSPSAVSVTAQVQQSADGSTNWTNYTDLPGNGLLTVAAASTQATQDVVLQGAQAYVRLLVTATLTGGTSPTIPAIAWLALGGTTEYPKV